MNIFLQELRRVRRGLILWVLCQAALILMGYLEFSLVFKGNTDVAQVMKQLPPAFMTMMGVAPGIDFSVVGDFFFAMADFGLYVMAAYACLLGFSVVAREETGKTIEFLLSKPISRQGVLLYKYAAGLVCCLVMGAVTVMVTVFTFGLDPDGDLLISTLVWGGTSVLVELVYFLAGGMCAAVFQKASVGTAMNLLFLLGSIMMSRVVGLLNLSGPIEAFAVKYYFPMPDYVHTGTFGLWPWVMCVVWMVLFTCTALYRYVRRDF